MRYFYIFSLLLVYTTHTLQGQTDITAAKKAFPKIPSLEQHTQDNSPHVLPSTFRLQESLLTPKKKYPRLLTPKVQPNFTANTDVKSAAELYQDKFSEKKQQDDTRFRRNQYLGDFKTKGAFVRLVCRDHQYVDGDQIQVLHNDKVVQENIILSGKGKSIQIDLTPGFNKISFKALNVGLSAPNTAELKIYNASGDLEKVYQWDLATGFSASVIVVK